MAEVEFAAGLYSLEAIKQAAYRFTDRLAIEIEPSDTRTVCWLRLVDRQKQSETLEFLADQFRNEVLDQDLRIELRQETAPVRNLILSLAFSKTGLQG